MSKIEWRGTTPFSRQFDDIYYHPEEGVAESRYVFCNGNRLAERFAELDNEDSFSIGELGFGTGLNFLVAAELFQQTASNSQHLYFTSFERFPLNAVELNAAIRHHASSPLSRAFIAAYNNALLHQNTFWLFDCNNIHLTLHIGDAETILGRCRTPADAWFFDGFAPSKNPELWSQRLFTHIACASRAHTTFSTFSAASLVRRNLTNAGFSVRKRPGFGKKRESLLGNVNPSNIAIAPPWLRSPPTALRQHPIAIIGAGLAGATTARSLAEHGFEVHIIEAQNDVACGTSGQKRLVLYPRLTRDWSVLGSYAWLGLAHQYQSIQRYCPQALDGNGVTLLGYTPSEAKRLQSIEQGGLFDSDVVRYLDAEELSDRIGVRTHCGGIDIPHGGGVDVRRYIGALIEHPRIRLIPQTTIRRIERGERWNLIGDNTLFDYASVILCTAHAHIEGIAITDLPIRRIRGQVSHIRQTKQSRSLKRVLCHKGYITPAIDGYHLVGATFNPSDEATQPNTSHDAQNLRTLKQHIGTMVDNLDLSDARTEDADVAFRATSTDHLPLVGGVCDKAALGGFLQPLASDASRLPQSNMPWLEGLYLNLALGSRGLVGSSLCAAHITSLITGAPNPLPNTIREHIEPYRFLRRHISRSTPRL